MILRRFIPRLFRQPAAPTIDILYGAIVAQARLPVFYAGFGVPDTVEGRFDMIVLHLVLVMRRLGRQVPSSELARGLFSAFCRDMDHNLREMGVGDLTVPKKVKRMAEAFYGRQRSYEAALATSDPAALVAAVGRNVFAGTAAGGAGAGRLAHYMRCSAARLDTVEAVALRGGSLAFASPDATLRKGPDNGPSGADQGIFSYDQ